MYKLCVFDLDGTLVDTLADLTASLNAALAKNGFPALAEYEVQRIIGYSTAYMCQNALPKDADKSAWEAVHRDYTAYYDAHCCDRSRIYEGMIRTVQSLKRAGATVAVVSNKPHKHAMRVIDTLFLRDTFSMVLGRMEKFATKPAPDALLFVLDYFGVAKKDAAYIGDSEVDVQFAKNAGIDCVSVGWGFRDLKTLKEAGAQCIVSDSDALLAALLNKKTE